LTGLANRNTPKPFARKHFSTTMNSQRPQHLISATAVWLLTSIRALSPKISPAATSGALFPSTCPQPLQVLRDTKSNRLIISNAYYQVDHDLKRGGAISRIRLTHGKAENLLMHPLEASIASEKGGIFVNVNDPAPEIHHSTDGLTQVVTVESRLMDNGARAARGIRLRTRFEYHWGYIKVHQEFIAHEGGTRARELCALRAELVPALTHYGFREGITEKEGASAFNFGSCHWGKVNLANSEQASARTNYLPRYVMLADPGIEGLEWFEGSDLSQWDLQLTGRRGQGDFELGPSRKSRGIRLKLSPLLSGQPVTLTNSSTFDYYLSVPILEGHARRPWLHTSFNRSKGDWVSTEQVKHWAESGIRTVHCHNDGDYYEDGLFWRDGSYPPYPDMDRYDKVIDDCHAAGIRAATYFSNKELHPSTPEFKEHGMEWGRKNLKGDLAHNFFKGTNEFGAQMCLRSGWLQFLEFSIDRVLTHHRLDGVYYDWNVALLCNNPQHQTLPTDPDAAAHWDIDELLRLMEWTRQRVSPKGLIIVHNTTTPMFATENFADHVVANEWGYGKWTGNGPDLIDLPLEWSLVGARSRGVISYGQLDAQSAPRLRRVFAMEALLGGVTPWPASQETFELFDILKPIGEIESCQFEDWRNEAVTLQGTRCASAVYSREGETYLLVANLDGAAQEPLCTLHPENLPLPIKSLSRAAVIRVNQTGSRDKGSQDTRIDIQKLTRGGVRIPLEGDSAVLIKVQ
jgi:hypothetical protein